MKKLFSPIATLAIAAFSLFSCQEKVEIPEASGKHSVHFTVDLQSETKTALEGTSVNWVPEDASLFHVFENGVEATGENLVVDFTGGIATVTAIFDDSEATEFTYNAYVSSLNTAKKPVILATQTPTAKSFDPAADILFAKPITTGNQDESLDLKFQFSRPVSINKMTLKGIKAGETIKKVTLEGNKALGGSFDPKNDYKYSASDKLLAINATTDVVYFISAAVSEVVPTITVTTDKAVYSKTFSKPISFVANELHSFSVSFSDDDRNTADTEYGLVTSLSDLAAGDVIVLGCSNFQKAAGLFNSNTYFSAQDANIASGVLKSANAVEITLGKTGDNWTLTTSEGKIGANKAKELVINSGVDTWTISFAEESAVIASTTSENGCILYNSTSPRFLNYTSGMKSIEIYKKGFNPAGSTANSATASVTFSREGLANAADVTNVDIDEYISVSFDKGTNNNAPKYYTTGEAVRVYGSNTFTIESTNGVITNIKITFGATDGSNEITTNVGQFKSPNWMGSANSITFTIGGTTGNRRISAIEVTYEKTI